MAANCAYLWRSALAQRLYTEIDNPEEARRFIGLLAAEKLPESKLRQLSDLWMRLRRPGETLVAFLGRMGWF